MLNTVISYCTNDTKFLYPCAVSANLFSDNVFVVHGESFYDGRQEDQKQLNEDEKRVDFATFISNPYKPEFHPRWHHNSARFTAVEYMRSRGLDQPYTLFLDADEIVDPADFSEWLESTELTKDAYELECFWYFREPQYQALSTERAGLLVRTDKLSKVNMFGQNERWSISGPDWSVERKVRSTSNEPMVHHFSWVRSKEGMLRKVRGWGHSQDRDWPTLIEEEFSREFTHRDTDFVHKYRYKVVDPYIEWA